ncbi:alpha/beta fold hydrolase [Nocardioides thalensis]
MVAALVACNGRATPGDPPTEAASVGQSPDVLSASLNGVPELCGEPPKPSRRGKPAPPEGLPANRYLFCAEVVATTADGGEHRWNIQILTNEPSPDVREKRLVFVHAGGPGLASTGRLAAVLPTLDYSQSVAVSWDGSTSSSEPGACGPASAAYGVDRSDWETTASQVAEECGARDGEAPWLASAGSAAEELEATRIALGKDQVDLLTYSYGTAVAQAYLALYPERVSRAVLDGPIVLETPWDQRIAAMRRATSRAWNEMVRRCLTRTCPAQTRQLLRESAGYAQVRARLLEDPVSVGSGQQDLTPTIVDQATLMGLRTVSTRKGLVQGIREALAGDGTDLWQYGTRQYFGLDRAVYLDALCHDLRHPGSIEAFAVDGDPLTASFATDLAPCALAPFIEFDTASNSRARVLVMASDLDPLTPWELVQHGTWSANTKLCHTHTPGHTGGLFRGPRLAAKRMLSGDAFRCPP